MAAALSEARDLLLKEAVQPLSAAEKEACTKACGVAVGREPWMETAIADDLVRLRYNGPGFQVTCEVAVFEADGTMARHIAIGDYDAVVCEDSLLIARP